MERVAVMETDTLDEQHSRIETPDRRKHVKRLILWSFVAFLGFGLLASMGAASGTAVEVTLFLLVAVPIVYGYGVVIFMEKYVRDALEVNQ